MLSPLTEIPRRQKLSSENPLAHRWPRIILTVLGFHLVLLLIFALSSCSCAPAEADSDAADNALSETNSPSASAAAELAKKALLLPVRSAPPTFKRNQFMPDKQESEASGAIHLPTFSAGRDLTFVDDPRVWWESDNDGENDVECDHTMHVSMVEPFRRLVELVAQSNATLKVQEAYRPIGTHASKSLHKEGRAIDLTWGAGTPGDQVNIAVGQPGGNNLPLDALAKLAWQAGFDWVYYECPRASGPHIHASVRREKE